MFTRALDVISAPSDDNQEMVESPKITRIGRVAVFPVKPGRFSKLIRRARSLNCSVVGTQNHASNRLVMLYRLSLRSPLYDKIGHDFPVPLFDWEVTSGRELVKILVSKKSEFSASLYTILHRMARETRS